VSVLHSPGRATPDRVMLRQLCPQAVIRLAFSRPNLEMVMFRPTRQMSGLSSETGSRCSGFRKGQRPLCQDPPNRWFADDRWPTGLDSSLECRTALYEKFGLEIDNLVTGIDGYAQPYKTYTVAAHLPRPAKTNPPKSHALCDHFVRFRLDTMTEAVMTLLSP
jgi:hypothetical protein